MERSVIAIQPGIWIAWKLDGGFFVAQVHREAFEVPPTGRLIGIWGDEPSKEETDRARDLAGMA